MLKIATQKIRWLAGIAVLVTGLLACNLGQQPAQQPPNVEATIAAGVVATQQAIDLQATIEAAAAATRQAEQLTTAPTSAPVVTTPLPVSTTPSDLSDLAQVQNVIKNEVNAAAAQDLPLLESLYATDAVVIDRAGTPDEPGDDTIWRGWPNIQRRYEAFFSADISSITLVDVSVQMTGSRAVATHKGALLDGVLYPDRGVYRLEKIDDQWLITQLEYGNLPSTPTEAGSQVDARTPAPPSGRDDGLYDLRLGSQHRYEEPWGWDRGDPCQAYENDDFDDTRPNYRGFNVELLLTNNSDKKVPDNWPVEFTTAQGKSVEACYYAYPDSGPPPGATSSVTFFTVVEQGDYVETITLNLEGQTVRICLDGQGGWRRC